MKSRPKQLCLPLPSGMELGEPAPGKKRKQGGGGGGEEGMLGSIEHLQRAKGGVGLEVERCNPPSPSFLLPSLPAGPRGLPSHDSQLLINCHAASN